MSPEMFNRLTSRQHLVKRFLRSHLRMRMYARLLAKCAWLIWLFLLSSLHLSLAQEPPAAAPESSTEDSVPGSEDEEALRDRPVIKRFGARPLTPEEQEEAKRLSAIAAKMGTDPTAIIGRVQTLFRHDALEGGNRVSNNLVARIDVPFHKDFLLRADLPYVWSHPNQFGTSIRAQAMRTD